MCGIGGIVGSDVSRRALEQMGAAMAHRGPDGNGIWLGDEAGLSFRRLAIIDLHERSNQPLELGPWKLVFNGEIYNYLELRDELRGAGHRFVTEGDGEVLLHAWDEWGEGSLERLNGMFAFAIWHDGDKRLTLVSDPFGEKPVYWCEAGDRFVFASDVPAILAVQPEQARSSFDAVAGFLASGLLPPIEDSFFAGIRRLPGAHLLRRRAGRTEIARYWTPRRIDCPDRYEDGAAELRQLLRDSVRLRLRSDVPIGTSLSGGIDSSAVVALCGDLAAEHTRHAFTASFPGFARDELQYAEAIASAAGVVEHHVVQPTAGELFADLHGVVRDQQEPFQSLSIYAQWRVMRAARDAGIVVLLDGQGADELFAGYDGAAGWAIKSLPRRTAVRELRHGDLTVRDVALATLRGPLLKAVARRHRLYHASPYAAAEVRERASQIDPTPLPPANGREPLERELLRQTFHTSLPGLLRYADRDSMAHSREVRLPFLDRRVAEFALSLPAAFLYRDGRRKSVLREAMRGLVPDRILDRNDKIGFEPPQASWLATPAARSLIRDVLLDPRARARALYDVAAIEHDLRVGSWRDQAAVWRALSAELWFGACVDSVIPAASAAA
jgi:asparagine synthase (glutamine-hydrolysing)